MKIRLEKSSARTYIAGGVKYAWAWNGDGYRPMWVITDGERAWVTQENHREWEDMIPDKMDTWPEDREVEIEGIEWLIEFLDTDMTSGHLDEAEASRVLHEIAGDRGGYEIRRAGGQEIYLIPWMKVGAPHTWVLPTGALAIEIEMPG